MHKQAIVIHSVWPRLLLCLALATREYGVDGVLSFPSNMASAIIPNSCKQKKFAGAWNIDHVVLNVDCLKEITENSLTNHSLPIIHEAAKRPIP